MPHLYFDLISYNLILTYMRMSLIFRHTGCCCCSQVLVCIKVFLRIAWETSGICRSLQQHKCHITFIQPSFCNSDYNTGTGTSNQTAHVLQHSIMTQKSSQIISVTVFNLDFSNQPLASSSASLHCHYTPSPPTSRKSPGQSLHLLGSESPDPRRQLSGSQ